MMHRPSNLIKPVTFGFLILVVVIVITGVLSARGACAHDPRFVCSPRDETHAVTVPDPGKSWAFYGGLQGTQVDTFKFHVSATLDVPVSLLVDTRDRSNPALPVATISNDLGRPVAQIDFAGASEFYEPFSHLSYLQTKERTLKLQPGSYSVYIRVRAAAVRQRYTFAMGAAERFSIFEIPYVGGAILRIRSQDY